MGLPSTNGELAKSAVASGCNASDTRNFFTMEIVPDDNALYLVSPGTRSLLVGRLADRKVVSEIDVGDLPYWVAIMGEK